MRQAQSSQPEIRGVIFDLDETLVRIEKLYDEAYRRLAHKYGKDDEGLLIKVRRAMIGKGEPFSTTSFMQAFGLQRPDESEKEGYERLKAELKQIQLEVFQDAEYMPGAREFVEFLEARGIPAAIATASSGGPLVEARMHDKPELQRMKVVTGDKLPGLRDKYNIDPDEPDSELNKPKPYIFWHAGEEVGIPLYQCAVVEDAIPGLIAAIQAGARLVIFVPNEFVNMDKARAEIAKLQAEDQVWIRDSLVGLDQELEQYLHPEPGNDVSMK